MRVIRDFLHGVAQVVISIVVLCALIVILSKVATHPAAPAPRDYSAPSDAPINVPEGVVYIDLPPERWHRANPQCTDNRLGVVGPVEPWMVDATDPHIWRPTQCIPTDQ